MRSNGSAAQGAETGAADGDASHGQPFSEAEADAKVIHLAGLTDLAYGRERSKAAKAMGLPVTWLDRIVRSKKAAIVTKAAGSVEAEGGGQGRPINLSEPEPWPDMVDGAVLLLANDGISPNSTRLGEDTGKGYERAQFEDAFARYLPPSSNPTVTPSQRLDFCGFSANPQPSQGNRCDGSEIDRDTSVSAGCDGVTVGNQGEPPKSARVRVRL
jgi:hypothetical protein